MQLSTYNFLTAKRVPTIKQILLIGACGRVFSPIDEFAIYAVWKILKDCW